MFAIVMATLTFAAIPWAIAQITVAYQPKLQASARHRRNFRLITAFAALTLTIPAMAGGPWTYLLAITAAATLSIKWYRFARTPHGKVMLAEAKQRRRKTRRDRQGFISEAGPGTTYNPTPDPTPDPIPNPTNNPAREETL